MSNEDVIKALNLVAQSINDAARMLNQAAKVVRELHENMLDSMEGQMTVEEWLNEKNI